MSNVLPSTSIECLLLETPVLLPLQAGLGSITGAVLDDTGSVIPGDYVFTLSSRGFKEKRLNRIEVNGFQQSVQGVRLSDGFALPEQAVSRFSSSIKDPVTIYNNDRTGAGVMNVSGVQPPMRIVEVGLKIRF